MSRRDTWDKLHRSDAVRKGDYTEEIRLSPRNPLPSQYRRGLIARKEAEIRLRREEEINKLTFTMRQGVRLCPAFTKWFQEQRLDESRLLNAVRAALGQALRAPDPVTSLERDIGGRFFRFNELACEITARYPGVTLAGMPECFVQWLHKFRRRADDRDIDKPPQSKQQGPAYSVAQPYENTPATPTTGLSKQRANKQPRNTGGEPTHPTQ